MTSSPHETPSVFDTRSTAAVEGARARYDVITDDVFAQRLAQATTLGRNPHSTQPAFFPATSV